MPAICRKTTVTKNTKKLATLENVQEKATDNTLIMEHFEWVDYMYIEDSCRENEPKSL